MAYLRGVNHQADLGCHPHPQSTESCPSSAGTGRWESEQGTVANRGGAAGTRRSWRGRMGGAVAGGVPRQRPAGASWHGTTWARGRGQHQAATPHPETAATRRCVYGFSSSAEDAGGVSRRRSPLCRGLRRTGAAGGGGGGCRARVPRWRCQSTAWEGRGRERPRSPAERGGKRIP